MTLLVDDYIYNRVKLNLMMLQTMVAFRSFESFRRRRSGYSCGFDLGPIPCNRIGSCVCRNNDAPSRTNLRNGNRSLELSEIRLVNGK